MELKKADILNYFSEAKCSTCEFREECDRNDNELDSIPLCSLFGIG